MQADNSGRLRGTVTGAIRAERMLIIQRRQSAPSKGIQAGMLGVLPDAGGGRECRARCGSGRMPAGMKRVHITGSTFAGGRGGVGASATDQT